MKELQGNVSIRLLGDFRVASDGRQIEPEDWPSLRAGQLVQLLALADGRRLHKEQVIDALWPQLDPQAGSANLRKAAHHARQALGRRDAVVLKGGQVILFPLEAVCVDADHFERLADAALARGEPGACEAAANAYGGDLLPAAPYEPWCESARGRLRARYLELLRASAQWERLALAEPADEPAHRELMRRELAAGNRAAAIRWYGRLRSALEQSLGLLPGPQTEALYAQCIEGLRPALPSFVGRQAQLAQAEAWLSAPTNQGPGGLVVAGAPGIGKSALLRQIGALARGRGFEVVSVDAVRPTRPYAVTATVVEQLILEDRSVLERVGAPVRSVLAALSALAAPAPALQGPLGRHQVIGALRRMLLAAAGDARVLLSVDDAEQTDEADADVLLQMVVTGSPVRVALALRQPAPPTRLARGVARLLGGHQLAAMELGPLADAEATDLVAHAVGRPLACDVVAQIVRLAEGVPFSLLELARSNPAEVGARLPASAAETLTARLCDVGDELLSLLNALALAGDEFDTATVLALSPFAESETCAALDAALTAGILVVAEARYRFRHELVRQALIERIAPHRRLKLHRNTACRLAAINAPAALTAHHWLAGGSPAEAAVWLLAAAREALQLAAFSDALRHLEFLLAYAPDHVEALRLRAEALDALGNPGAVAAYKAAAKAAGRTKGDAKADDLLAKAALAQIKQGDPKGAVELLRGVRPASVEGRLCEALTYSGAAALGATDPAMGTRKAAEARRLALQAGDTAGIVVASWAQAAAAHARGELHSSVWADLLDTQHLPHLAVRVFDGHLCITQRFLYGARPYPEVIAFADALVAEAQRLGAARGRAFGVTLRGEAELLSGDLDAAEQHLTLGGRLHRAIGGATGEALTLQRRAELALYRGRRDLATELLQEALDLARQTDIGFHLLDRIYGTRLALAADPAAALSLLEDAQEAVRGPLETCPGCRITFAVPAAIAAARAGRLDLAEDYERASEYLANVVMRLPAWHAALHEVRAHVAQARGEDRAAVAAGFADAARKFEQAGQPLDAARCDQLARRVPPD